MGCRGEWGCDAGKKVNGRIRHVLVMVLPANIQDRDAARLLLERLYGPQRRRSVKHIRVDRGYAGALLV